MMEKFRKALEELTLLIPIPLEIKVKTIDGQLGINFFYGSENELGLNKIHKIEGKVYLF